MYDSIISNYQVYVVCNVTETETTVPVPVLKIPGPPAQKELLAAWTSKYKLLPFGMNLS